MIHQTVGIGHFSHHLTDGGLCHQGDEADIPSDYCRSTLEAEEVAAASVVWTTEGAPLVLRSPGKPLLHPEKAAMGMGDVPNKDLVIGQQKSTQTL